MKRLALLLLLAACADTAGPSTYEVPRATALRVVIVPSTSTNRHPLVPQPVVQLLNPHGAPVPLPDVPVTVTLTGGGGTLLGTTTVKTSALGTAFFQDLSIAGTAGVHALTFSTPGSAVSPPMFVTTTPGEPDLLVIVTGNNQDAPAGTAVPVQPGVMVLDRDGNTIQSVLITFEVQGGGGSITGATSRTDIDGIAYVGSWTLGAVPGPNALAANFAGTTANGVVFAATGH